MERNHGRRPLVCLLASAQTSPATLYGLYDVLSTAGVIYGEMTRGASGEKILDVKIVAASAGPFRCYGGVPVEPHAALDEIATANVVIVCDMYTRIDTPPRGIYAREIEWLKRLHAAGTMIGSVCSGSLVLAEAGLLDGKQASGHWAYRDLFQRCYPRVELRLDRILCFAAEGERIVTAAGATAWQELALYVIASLSGPAHAIEAAKIHIFAEHVDGQLPYSVMTHGERHDDSAIAECQRWIADNYAVGSPVAAMAARSDMSARTFARRFRAATGIQPIDYVQRVRVEEAKRRLEITAESVEEVARMVGYEDPTFFRRLFKRLVGMTPADYRRKFVRLSARSSPS